MSSNAVFFWAAVVRTPTQVLLLKAPGLFEPFFVARAPTSGFSCLDSSLAGSTPKSARAGFVWAAVKPASPTSKVSQSNAVWRRRHALDSAPAFCPSPLYSISIRIIIGLLCACVCCLLVFKLFLVLSTYSASKPQTVNKYLYMYVYLYR